MLHEHGNETTVLLDDSHGVLSLHGCLCLKIGHRWQARPTSSLAMAHQQVAEQIRVRNQGIVLPEEYKEDAILVLAGCLVCGHESAL